MKKAELFRITAIISLLMFLFLGLTTTGTGQDTTDNKFGKGISIFAKDSSFSMKFSTRFQTLLQVNAPMNNDFAFDLNGDGKFQFHEDVDTRFMIRRARLKFDGFAYSPKLKYKIELGLSNRDISGGNEFTSGTPRIILDAVLKWNFYKNLTLWAGQTKLPGNRERVNSSQQLQFVDRSLVNSRFNIDRDAGIQLRHHFKVGNVVFREIGSVSLGEGRGYTAANQGGFDYTARLEVLPLGKFEGKGDYFGSDLNREESPKIAFGISYDFNDNAVRQRGQLGSFLDAERDLQSLMADMIFKFKGISLASEYITKTTPTSPLVLNEEGVVTGAFYTGSGFVVQGGYLFKNNFELAGRYTTIMPENITGRDDITQYTVGVSRYIRGHSLKVQSDISYTTEGRNKKDMMYRLQVEMAF